MKSILRILLTEFSKTIFTPSFANTMCLLHNVNQIYLKRLDCSLNRIGIVVKS